MEHISIIAQLLKKNPAAAGGTIYIRGYFNRRSIASKSTGQKVLSVHWDHHARQVMDGMPNANLINTVIAGKIHAMQKLLLQKEMMGTVITPGLIKKAVRGDLDETRDFISFCRDRIKIDYSNKETRRSYLGECTKMEQFTGHLSFGDINYDLLSRYKAFMRDRLKNDPNTVWKSFKFLNTMLSKALKIGGIIDANPMKSFDRGKYIQRPKIGMEIDHCNKIAAICIDPLHPVILRRVGMYMLLMAYSGMRFSDAMRFDPDQHVKDGRLVMDYQKFSSSVNFVVHDRLQKAIDWIRDNRLKLSNKDFNIWAKVLGTLIGLSFDLTSHRGRHTMGGLLADLEIPEEQAQVILGHKDIRSTRVYYHVKNKAVDKSIGKMNSL